VQDDCIAVALGLPELKVIVQKEFKGLTLSFRERHFKHLPCGKVFTESDEVSNARSRSSKCLRKHFEMMVDTIIDDSERRKMLGIIEDCYGKSKLGN